MLRLYFTLSSRWPPFHCIQHIQQAKDKQKFYFPPSEGNERESHLNFQNVRMEGLSIVRPSLIHKRSI